MRTWKHLSFALMLAGAFAGAASAQQTQTADETQPQAGNSTAGPVTTVNQAIDRIIAREQEGGPPATPHPPPKTNNKRTGGAWAGGGFPPRPPPPPPPGARAAGTQ